MTTHDFLTALALSFLGGSVLTATALLALTRPARLAPREDGDAIRPDKGVCAFDSWPHTKQECDQYHKSFPPQLIPRPETVENDFHEMPHLKGNPSTYDGRPPFGSKANDEK